MYESIGTAKTMENARKTLYDLDFVRIQLKN